MQTETIRRPRGRPPHKPTDGLTVAQRMASVLMVYQIDLANVELVHKVLWRSNFRYQDAMDHVDEAIALAMRRRKNLT